MMQARIIKIVDLLSFLSLIGMMVTGLVLEYLLPQRSGGSEIWSLSRHDWGDVHYYFSLLFLALISTHLLTHKRYIKLAIMGRADREHKYRVVIGFVAVATLIIFVVMLFTAPVDNLRHN